MDKKEKLHPSLEEQIRKAEQIRDQQNDSADSSREDDSGERCLER